MTDAEAHEHVGRGMTEAELGPARVLNYTGRQWGSSRLGASCLLVGVQRNRCTPLRYFRV